MMALPTNLWQNANTQVVTAWIMDGAGHRTRIMTLRNPSTDDGWRVATTADINHDGIPDILWQNATTPVVNAWIMDGAGPASKGMTIRNMPTDDGWRAVGAADINHDGIDDILWQNLTSHTAIAWIMDGTGPQDKLAHAPNRARCQRLAREWSSSVTTLV